MRSLILAIVVFGTSSALAYSIPPSTMSVRDLAVIFTESEILSRIGTSGIKKVTLVSPGVYRVSTGQCSLDVKVKDVSKPTPGFIGNGGYTPAVDSYDNQTCQ